MLEMEKKMDSKITWAHSQQERYEQILNDFKSHKEATHRHNQSLQAFFGDRLNNLERHMEDVKAELKDHDILQKQFDKDVAIMKALKREITERVNGCED